MVWTQILWLFVLAIPVACISWTVIREEVFREPREYCIDKSQKASKLIIRKFFYLFTCEYCFSHYVTIFILLLPVSKCTLTIGADFLFPDFPRLDCKCIYEPYSHIRLADQTRKSGNKKSAPIVKVHFETGKKQDEDSDVMTEAIPQVNR